MNKPPGDGRQRKENNMIKSILNQASQLIRDYPAEKARKEKIREQMAIREAKFMKRFEEKTGSTEMKTYKIKIRTHEEWETPDSNLRSSNARFERIIDVNSFKDALDYVEDRWLGAEGVTITSLKIKEID